MSLFGAVTTWAENTGYHHTENGINGYAFDESFLTNASNTTAEPVTLGPQVPLSPCLWIFVKFIGDTYIVPWDIFLLVPNAVFFLFLLVTLRRSVRALRSRCSPIVNTFYVLIWLTTLLGTVRCVVILFFSRFNTLHNEILWLFVRFFQLVMELSVLILGLIYGQADSSLGIRRVLAITFTLGLAYAVAQGVLEKLYHKVYFQLDLYLHGGLMFILISSACFSAIYFIVTILPLLPIRRFNLVLPKKPSFYIYTGFFCVLNVIACVGASLVQDFHDKKGFCLVSVSLFAYFGLFSPIIYVVFLQPFLIINASEDTSTTAAAATTTANDTPETSSTESSRLLEYSYGMPTRQFDYTGSVLNSATKSYTGPRTMPVLSQTSIVDLGGGESYPGSLQLQQAASTGGHSPFNESMVVSAARSPVSSCDESD